MTQMNSRDIYRLRAQSVELIEQLIELSKENYEVAPYSDAVKAASALNRALHECFSDKCTEELYEKYADEEDAESGEESNCTNG